MELPSTTGAGAGICWRFANAQLDESAQELRIGGQLVELERKPLEILLCLLRSAGEVLTKDELLEAVWPGRVVVEGALSVAISKLRQALGEGAQDIVATVHGYGYRLAVPVERLRVRGAAPLQVELKPGDAVPRREHWTLQRRLGTHGDVWLAAHAKTREQRVFKFSLDGERLTALKREATLSRVLRDAMGEREDFARVLEWNFEHAPFFLECEYGGENLDEWLASQGGAGAVPLAQRLELMAGIAEAVAAAHSAGVLHKDLKPANVLVYRRTDGHWRARLTDFGSGRLLDPQQLAQMGITRLGFTQTQVNAADSSGTPLYLAPEVVGGRAPSVQSDIYALGVILYQLITGDFRRQLAPGWEQDIDDELLRQDIAATASGEPGKRLASAQDLAERLRTLESRRLELDARRTAEARALEAERALQLARVRRPWLVALCVALAAGAALSVWYYRDATLARDDAQKQAALAQAVTKFLSVDILKTGDPLDSRNRPDITVAQAIAAAVEKLDAGYIKNPETEAAVRLEIGKVFSGYSDYENAAAQVRRAIALSEAALGRQADLTLKAQYQLVAVLTLGSKYDEAKAVLAAADARRAEAGGGNAQLAPHIEEVHGLLLAAQQKYEEALPWMRRAFELQESQDADDFQALYDYGSNLASVQAQVGQAAEAIVVLQKLMDRFPVQDRERSTAFAYLKFLLGRAQYFQGQKADAEKSFAAAYAVFREVLGEDAARTNEVLGSQADLYYSMGDAARAAQALEPLYKSMRRRNGADDPNTLLTLGNMGIVKYRAGKLESAAGDLDASYRGLVAKLQKEHTVSQFVGYYHANAELEFGRAAAARHIIPTLDAKVVAHTDPNADWQANLDLLKGRLLLADGKTAEARALLLSAQARLKEKKVDAGDLIVQLVEAALARAGAGP